MKNKIKRFTVTGKGRFPTDMLRYDSCWPDGPGDVSRIELDETELRTITLRSYHDPTIARWSSFLWGCSEATAI